MAHVDKKCCWMNAVDPFFKQYCLFYYRNTTRFTTSWCTNGWFAKFFISFKTCIIGWKSWNQNGRVNYPFGHLKRAFSVWDDAGMPFWPTCLERYMDKKRCSMVTIYPCMHRVMSIVICIVVWLELGSGLASSLISTGDSFLHKT